jgi:hypothetical protein
MNQNPHSDKNNINSRAKSNPALYTRRFSGRVAELMFNVEGTHIPTFPHNFTKV